MNVRSVVAPVESGVPRFQVTTWVRYERAGSEEKGAADAEVRYSSLSSIFGGGESAARAPLVPKKIRPRTSSISIAQSALPPFTTICARPDWLLPRSASTLGGVQILLVEGERARHRRRKGGRTDVRHGRGRVQRRARRRCGFRRIEEPHTPGLVRVDDEAAIVVNVVRERAEIEREDVQRTRRVVEAAELARLVERDPELAVREADDLRRGERSARQRPDRGRRDVGSPADDRVVDEVEREERSVRVLPRVGVVVDAGRLVVDEVRDRGVEEGEVPSRLGQPELSVGPLHERRGAAGAVRILGHVSRRRIEMRDLEAAELRDPEGTVAVAQERARGAASRHDPARELRAVARHARDDVFTGRDGPHGSVRVLHHVGAVVDSRPGERIDLRAGRDRVRGRRWRGGRRRRRCRRRLLSQSGKSQGEGDDRDPRKTAGGAHACHVGHCSGPGCTLRSAPRVAKSGRFDAPELLGVGFVFAGRPRTSESPTAPQTRSRNGRRDRGRPARENPSQGPDARRMRAFARNAVPGRKPRGKSVGSHRGANPGGSI